MTGAHDTHRHVNAHRIAVVSLLLVPLSFLLPPSLLLLLSALLHSLQTNRFGFEPSAELMARLTPTRRQMLVDLNHPNPQPWATRGRHSPRSAVNLTGQYGVKAEAEASKERGVVADSSAKL